MTPATIRPIRTSEDYETALQQIEALMGTTQEGTPDRDVLELLVTLVEHYEDRHYPIELPSDPVEALKAVMDFKGLRKIDIAPYLGAPARVTDVLSGRRKLTVEMIRNLSEGLHVPPEIFLGGTAYERAS